MRQAVIPRHGPPDVFEMREAPDPEPGQRRDPNPRPRRRHQLRRRAGADSGSILTHPNRPSSSATKSPGTYRRNRPRRHRLHRRRPRRGADAVRRLLGHGRRTGRAGLSLPRRAERLGSGGGPGHLPDGRDCAVPHGGARAERNGARTQCRRRRWHCRHPARAAASRDGDRHGVRLQARRAAELRRRTRDRLPPCGRRRGGADAHARPRCGRDPRSHRRTQLHDELSAAGAARAADHLRVVGRGALGAPQPVACLSSRGSPTRGSIRCRSSTGTEAYSACTSATSGKSGGSSRRSWTCSWTSCARAVSRQSSPARFHSSAPPTRTVSFRAGRTLEK